MLSSSHAKSILSHYTCMLAKRANTLLFTSLSFPPNNRKRGKRALNWLQQIFILPPSGTALVFLSTSVFCSPPTSWSIAVYCHFAPLNPNRSPMQVASEIGHWRSGRDARFRWTAGDSRLFQPPMSPTSWLKQSVKLCVQHARTVYTSEIRDGVHLIMLGTRAARRDPTSRPPNRMARRRQACESALCCCTWIGGWSWSIDFSWFRWE